MEKRRERQVGTISWGVSARQRHARGDRAWESVFAPHLLPGEECGQRSSHYLSPTDSRGNRPRPAWRESGLAVCLRRRPL